MVIRPGRIQHDAEIVGAMWCKSDGQTHPVVQPNGIGSGEVVFFPPKALLDGEGVFDGIPALLPDMTERSILSLTAEDEDGNAIFTAGIANGVLACLMNTIGAVRTTQDRIPPGNEVGWYDPNNPLTTRFGAVNLTNYDVVGVANALVTDEVIVMEMADGEIGYPGMDVMGGWEASGDFGKIVPILTRGAKTGINTDGSDHITASQMDDWIVNIESLVDASDHTTSAIDADTQLIPGLDSTQQVQNTTITSGTVDIAYEFFSLGNLIPLSQMYKLKVGKIVFSDLQAGGNVGVDFKI